ARLAALIEYCGGDPRGLPLSDHRHDSFYTMRTDALDRFGTRIEHRFSRAQIETMMCQAGLDDIRFSEASPFWCAVGRKLPIALSRGTAAFDERARSSSVGNDSAPRPLRPAAKHATQAQGLVTKLLRSPGAILCALALLVVPLFVAFGVALDVPAVAAPKTPLHHAPNRNFDLRGNYLPGRVGFNLADVSSVAQLNSLPNGVKGLVWVGQCKGVDPTFIRTVTP